jgi:excisionase family DNA binding protein
LTHLWTAPSRDKRIQSAPATGRDAYRRRETAKYGALKMKSQQRLLSNSDVCVRLQCSRSTVWRLVRQGLLRPIKIGSLTRYRIADVETIEARGTAEPAEATAADSTGGAK